MRQTRIIRTGYQAKVLNTVIYLRDNPVIPDPWPIRPVRPGAAHRIPLKCFAGCAASKRSTDFRIISSLESRDRRDQSTDQLRTGSSRQIGVAEERFTHEGS
jgi:hypothetical protein